MSNVNKKFGALLKSERERQNLTIEDIAEKLKLVQSNLEAIEKGDASKLPSELYFTLFSKTYAEALGIDYSRTMEAIRDELNNNVDSKEKSPAKPNEAAKEEHVEEESSRELIKKISYFGGGIVLVFVLFLILNHYFFSSSGTGSDIPLSNEDNIEETGEDALKAEYSNYNWETPAFEKPKKIKLTLIPREESWSTVLADGDTVIYRTLREGRTYTAEADYRLLVSIGIPSVVKVLLNDKEVSLRDQESKRISRVLIDQTNYKSFLTPPKETVDSPPKKTTEKKENTSADIPDFTPDDINETSSLETDES